MSDKICPPTKSIGVANGIVNPESHVVLTTPMTTFGRYYGSQSLSGDAVNTQKIMGSK